MDDGGGMDDDGANESTGTRKGYEAADEVSVGFVRHDQPDEAEPSDGALNQGSCSSNLPRVFLTMPEWGEHVAENMIAGGDEFAAMVVPFAASCPRSLSVVHSGVFCSV